MDILWPFSTFREGKEDLNDLIDKEPVALGHYHRATTKSQSSSVWVKRNWGQLKGTIVPFVCVMTLHHE